MRKKLVRNYLFYQHYPYKPSSADLSTVSCLFSSLCLFCYHLLLILCAESDKKANGAGWSCSYTSTKQSSGLRSYDNACNQASRHPARGGLSHGHRQHAQSHMWFRRYPRGQTDTHTDMLITVLYNRSHRQSNKPFYSHHTCPHVLASTCM